MKQQINTEEAVKILRLYLHCQSVIHMIDELHDAVIMKHEFKREMNRTLKFIEPKINMMLRNSDGSESQQYAEVVNEIDKVTEGISLDINKIQS